MFANRFTTASAVVAATAVGLAIATSAQAQETIVLDGSSTVFPISEAVAEDFMAANPDVQIAVGVSGTGGGFSKFCAGETVISNASRPIKPEEVEACAAAGIEYIEVLVGLDALALVAHPENDWLNDITFEELNTLWAPEAEGTITRWNQVNSSWPNAPIRLYGPGTDSGTFDYFTEEVVGESGASRADYIASEDDNILVVGVAGDENALGYFGLAYYLENQDILSGVAVEGVAASFETGKDGSYPLSRPLFIYISTDALERPEVEAYVRYYLETARDTDLLEEVGYIAVDSGDYDDALAQLDDALAGL
jgi:phosphate transport system substrate-binding protein